MWPWRVVISFSLFFQTTCHPLCFKNIIFTSLQLQERWFGSLSLLVAALSHFIYNTESMCSSTIFLTHVHTHTHWGHKYIEMRFSSMKGIRSMWCSCPSPICPSITPTIPTPQPFIICMCILKNEKWELTYAEKAINKHTGENSVQSSSIQRHPPWLCVRPTNH